MTTSTKRALVALIGLAFALLGLTLSGYGLGSAQAVDSSCPGGTLPGASSLTVPAMAPSASGVLTAPVPSSGAGSPSASPSAPSEPAASPPLIAAAASGGLSPDNGSGPQLGGGAVVTSSLVPTNPASLASLAGPVVAPLSGVSAPGSSGSAGSGPLVNVSAPVHSTPTSTTGTLVNVDAPVDSPPAE